MPFKGFRGEESYNQIFILEKTQTAMWRVDYVRKRGGGETDWKPVLIQAGWWSVGLGHSSEKESSNWTQDIFRKCL